MDKIILHGGGEHARVVLDSLLSQKVSVLGIFDPKFNDQLYGVKQLGEYDPSFAPGAKAIVSIGDNSLRKRVVEKTKHRFTNTIDPSAIISSRATLGEGCMILHGVIVQTQTKIGNHVIANTGARIDHDCQIGDYVHIAPGAVLCGTVKVGEGAFIGAGSTVLPGKIIGAWSIIGAGAVIIDDVPEGAVVVGNPGRIVKI